MWSTVPKIYRLFNLVYDFRANVREYKSDRSSSSYSSIEDHFTISIWSLLPLALMLICAWRKIPPIITILLNIIVAVIMIIIQNPKVSLRALGNTLENGFVSQTGNAQIDQLLSRRDYEYDADCGTYYSNVVSRWLINGIRIDFCGHGSCFAENEQYTEIDFINVINRNWRKYFIGEQFLSVILPGMPLKKFTKRRLDPTVLGRTLEDGGTVINYLIPWDCSFVAGTFGVPTLTYLPFVFFSLLSPVFSMVSAFTGLGIKRLSVEPVTEKIG